MQHSKFLHAATPSCSLEKLGVVWSEVFLYTLAQFFNSPGQLHCFKFLPRQAIEAQLFKLSHTVIEHNYAWQSFDLELLYKKGCFLRVHLDKPRAHELLR